MGRRKGIKTRPARRVSHSKPDKFDRIREHIKEGTELTPTDEQFYKRSIQIFNWMCEGKAEKEVNDLIVQNKWGGIRQAYKLIQDTKKLYGSEPIGANLVAERKILIEMAKEAYALAKTEKKGRDMISAVKVLADLIGVYEQDGGLQEIYDGLQLPDIIYTDDPTALYEPEQEGVFEEVEAETQKAISE